MEGCDVEELNVQQHHVHLLVSVPEGLDFQVDGYFEREASDKAVQELPWIEEKVLFGQPFLGVGVFRQYRRTG